ncbi:MAG: TIGR03767 family metallophosphoesterase [Frankiales bacterium]|nr:TIGR03767 family metallophosphoesterase [Frankiales bacterium]
MTDRQPTRRTVLKGAAVVGGLQCFPARGAWAGTGRPPAGAGTTLDSTVVRGAALNAAGYVGVTGGPGEPHVVRDGLGVKAQRGREGRRTGLLSFSHLTDIHVIDAQSPARVEFLDRYDDDPRTRTLFSSAYRPQEMLMPHVAESMVAAVGRIGRGPVSRRRLDFAICTGDNNDNSQLNELRWQIAVLDGTAFTPGSGDPARFEGVHDQDAATYDVHYWHPDGAPQGKQDDNLRRVSGFPLVKGLLEAATRTFTPTGLSMPWYTAFGNHDGLVQGNFPISFQLTRAAQGPAKIVSLPAGVTPLDVERAVTTGSPGTLAAAATAAPVRIVTADPMRRVLTRAETVKEHFTTGGTPLGHGYTAQNVADGTAYYVFEPSPQVRAIVLDTVNPNGNSNGSLDPDQFAWLRARLEEASGPGRNRLVVVFSHHTIESMDNALVATEDQRPRVQGPAVRDLLLQFPNVVLWVNGHTHRNRASAFRGSVDGVGFWQLNTSAHVDWPCQSRLVELVDNRDGTLSIFATLLDVAAPLAYAGRLDSSPALASLSRELALNDPQANQDSARGMVEDRNVELLVRAPFALTARPAPKAKQRQEPVSRQLPATGGTTALAAGAATALAAAVVLRRRGAVDPIASAGELP